MNPEEVALAIRQISFLHSMPPEVVDRVISVLQDVSRFRTVSMGETWIHEGDKKDERGFILVKGSVSIRKEGEPVHNEEAPELLGEIMQFNPTHARTATVVATDDCVVMRFDWDDFWAKLEEALTADEVEKVKSAVEGFAWEHFTR